MGLISATIECLANDREVAPEETLCSDVLKAIIEKIGAEHFPSPHRFDDAAWIGYRLSEVLPIGLDVKQQLLRMTDPQARLSQLGQILSAQGLPASWRSTLTFRVAGFAKVAGKFARITRRRSIARRGARHARTRQAALLAQLPHPFAAFVRR